MGSGIEQGLNGWQDPRTGLWFASQELAQKMGYNQPITYNQNPISPSYGQIDNSQKGSQFWMDSGYRGAEPDLATKAAFSDVGYARDWLKAYILNNIDPATASQPIKEIVGTYPTPSSVAIANVAAQVSGAGSLTTPTASNVNTGTTQQGSSFAQYLPYVAAAAVIAGLLLIGGRK